MMRKLQFDLTLLPDGMDWMDYVAQAGISYVDSKIEGDLLTLWVESITPANFINLEPDVPEKTNSLDLYASKIRVMAKDVEILDVSRERFSTLLDFDTIKIQSEGKIYTYQRTSIE